MLRCRYRLLAAARVPQDALAYKSTVQEAIMPAYDSATDLALGVVQQRAGLKNGSEEEDALWVAY
jgi:hypothetical protein